MTPPKNTPLIFVNTRPYSAADEAPAPAPLTPPLASGLAPSCAASSMPVATPPNPAEPLAPESAHAIASQAPFSAFASAPDTFLAAITGQSTRHVLPSATAVGTQYAGQTTYAGEATLARDALSAAALTHDMTIIDAPLLTCRRLDTPWPESAAIHAIAITSRHAVQALSEGGFIHGDRAKLPVYCVGDATAIAAFEAGFETVFSAEGTAADLARLLADDVEGTGGDSGNGHILFPCGAVITPSTMPAFESAGLRVLRWPVYAMDAATDFPPDLAAALTQGAAMVVPFFSGRSAQIWSDLMMAQGLKAATAQSWGLCIAAGVVKFVDCLDWKDIITPARPDMSAMVEALNGVMRTA